MEMAFLLHQMGVWVVVWEQAIIRKRSKLRRQGHLWVEPLYGPQPNIIFDNKKIVF
jgi:hypothetical protein